MVILLDAIFKISFLGGSCSGCSRQLGSLQIAGEIDISDAARNNSNGQDVLAVGNDHDDKTSKQIGCVFLLEHNDQQQGKADSYVFGFEESYGYLTGSYVRDKDGVDGAYMICEMFSYYATKGISLLDKLDELYKTYGYCLNTLHSYEFDGSAGFAKMQSIMQAFRGGIKEFGGKKVVRLLDYVQGLDGLPKSDVLKFLLEDNCSLVVRPSGTEPKLKIYISVSAENKEMAEEVEDEIAKTAEKWIC